MWERQARYFQAKGDSKYPSTIFIEDLTLLITSWHQAGEDVLLLIDSNQDVYNGPLAKALSKDGIIMGYLMEPAIGEKVTNSHFWESGKITTMFSTSGRVQGNAMCYPHWYGIGDHRVFLLKILALSLFGSEYPAIALPASRQLNCKITRIGRNYCQRLWDLSKRHNMSEKLATLVGTPQCTEDDQMQNLHNKWDCELGDFMISAEYSCNRFKSCMIEYSPTVGQLHRQQAILKWILWWQEEKPLTLGTYVEQQGGHRLTTHWH